MEPKIKIFVTYAWINEKPDNNVVDFVTLLGEARFEAVYDVTLAQKETAIHFSKMMAQNLQDADKVILVLSEKYKEKADSFSSGVGEEYQYIIEDIKKEKQKYILVTFDTDKDRVTPDFLRGRHILFLNKDNMLSDELLSKIHLRKDQPYPIKFDKLNDVIYQTTIESKLKEPFSSDDFLKQEKEWDTLFSLIISNCSEHFKTEQPLIQQVSEFILNSSIENPLKISGLPGAGISPFLSFLYRYLYISFEENKSLYPIYIDFRLYRHKIYQDGSDILEQAQDCLKKEVEDIKNNLSLRNIKEIILIFDGVDYDSMFQSPLEQVVISEFDGFQSKKIIGIRDYSDIKTERDSRGQTESLGKRVHIVFSHMLLENKKIQQLLQCFFKLFEKDNMSDLVMNILKVSDFKFIDYFLLNMLRKCTLSDKTKNISYFLRNYCENHLKEDNRKQEKMLFF